MHSNSTTAVKWKLIFYGFTNFQAESGAQLLQVFESSADHLTREHFIEFSAPYLKDIRSGVQQKLKEKNIEDVPMVRLFPIFMKY